MNSCKFKIKSVFLKLTLNLINKSLGFEVRTPHSEFLRDCSKFIINNKIVGDYYEFGVFRAGTTRQFFSEYNKFLIKRTDKGQSDKADSSEWFQALGGLKYHLFDSFEGLPEIVGVDRLGQDFSSGQYASTIDIVSNNLFKSGFSESQFKLYKGWFKDTFSSSKQYPEPSRKACLVWIDCDLYESAKDVMLGLDRIIQDGTIVVFDDWYCFSGHPKKGVRKAFEEWKDKVATPNGWIVTEYLNSGWALKSFILNRDLK